MSIKNEKQIFEDFKNGGEPMTNLSQDPLVASLELTTDAQSRLSSHVDVDLSETIPTENLQKRSELQVKMKNLAHFAKNHPFLTSGFMIALLLVGISAYFTINSLLGHTSFSILGAHPAIGGGITFMTLYYSIYLINLCRRAAIKDELASRLKAHEELSEELMKSEKVDLRSLTEKINLNIQNFHESQRTIESNLRANAQIVKQHYTTQMEALEKLKADQKKLEQLIEKDTKKMPKETQKILLGALNQTTNAIREGSLLLTKAPSFPSLEEIPQLSQLEIEFPDEPTPNMKENQKKQQALKGKFEIAFSENVAFIKKNPSGITFFVAGLMMCAFSGIALAFYLHGSSSIFFFGSISLTTLLPISTYGLNLLYEARNSSRINELKSQLKEIQEINAKRKEDLQAERKQLDEIRKKTSNTFQQFTEQWGSFLKLESASLREDMKLLETLPSISAAEAYVDSLLKEIAPFYEDLPPEEGMRIAQQFQQGAISFS